VAGAVGPLVAPACLSRIAIPDTSAAGPQGPMAGAPAPRQSIITPAIIVLERSFFMACLSLSNAGNRASLRGGALMSRYGASFFSANFFCNERRFSAPQRDRVLGRPGFPSADAHPPATDKSPAVPLCLFVLSTRPIRAVFISDASICPHGLPETAAMGKPRGISSAAVILHLRAISGPPNRHRAGAGRGRAFVAFTTGFNSRRV